MKRFLVLEDNAERIAFFRHILPPPEIHETVEPFIEALKGGGDFWLVSLDHDLNGEVFVDSNRKDCGMEVVRWIVAHKPSIAEIVLHTANPFASRLMEAELRRAGYVVWVSPFGGFDYSRGIPV